jgi:Holliday junction resolvase-like predicted endonuclease
VVTVRWRGAELDRMRDEGHAAVVATIASILNSQGWLTAAEVTYSEYGERGSIDLLAFHPETRILLVVEVKTEVVSVEETLRRHDAKVRLAARIARQRFGWSSVATCPLLAITDTRTARRRIERHDSVFGRTYPVRGWAARAWLRKPVVGAGLLLFLTGTSQVGGRPGPVGSKRVRVARPSGGEHAGPVHAGHSRPAGRPRDD